MVPQRTDLGAVLYDYNVLGSRGPRKMTGAIPRVDDASGQRAIFRSDEKGKDGIVDAIRKGEKDDIVVLRNKSPKWNDQMQAYCLNFNGRVTHASVKNFQLADEEDEAEEVMLQFGKVERIFSPWTSGIPCRRFKRLPSASPRLTTSCVRQ